MDSDEARAVLALHVADYRGRLYSDLVSLIDSQPEPAEVSGPSGARYQIEVVAAWDGTPGGDVRIIGSVDDGGWRAFAPVSDDFIMRPDGSFVGER